jgi:transcriptional regulator with XRE-family HTH domain
MRGKELRAIRKRLGWRQADLAEELGVTANTVARWERDEMEVSPPVEKLIRLTVGWREAARRLELRSPDRWGLRCERCGLPTRPTPRNDTEEFELEMMALLQPSRYCEGH